MKKIIAVLLSISIIVAGQTPALAQLVPAGKALGTIKTAEKASRAAQEVANITIPLSIIPPVVVQPPLLPQVQAQVTPLQMASVSSAVTAQIRLNTLARLATPSAIREQAKLGGTAFMPEAILAIGDKTERASLLRAEFMTAAIQGNATIEQLAQAVTFWRNDLSVQLASFKKNSSDTAALNALADMAGIGLFGNATDATDALLLLDAYNALEKTPFKHIAAAHTTRGLLRLGKYQQLQDFFAAHPNEFVNLQQGISGYAVTHDLPLQLGKPSASAPAVINPALRKQLEAYGFAQAIGANPSMMATSLWMRWGTKEDVTVPAANVEEAAVAATKAAEKPVLTPALTETPAVAASAEQLAAAPVTLPQGENAAPAQANNVPAATNATDKAVVPTNSVFKGLSFFRNKPHSKEVAGALQRASLYLAAGVVGLEVATPVIANFGTSFGLSLEDNILVAAATYLPYSVGALLSDFLKNKLGRKASMNIGLAMMGAGFLAGTTWVGLDGAFQAEPDALMHFYKALACITTASMGGVLVHSAVGPLMTEINAGLSDIIRQKRNTFTEFSRALGMMASFAFPFIATKLLGMDWSFTFAMPIPLVAASLIGLNMVGLPNTKPMPSAAKAAAQQVKGSLLDRIKNNSFIHLFKEEPGVGALLSGLAIMNAVERSINSGFLFLLPSLTKDPSSQYLFGLAQFAAPFLLGRFLARKFLTWFPNNNLTMATLMSSAGAAAAFIPGVLDNPYLLTSTLFAAETGISTAFTLAFARTARNPATQDRVTSLIVATALACAVGPMMLTDLAQTLIDSGIMSTSGATAAALIGLPAALALFSAGLFKRAESLGKQTKSTLKRFLDFIKRSVYHPNKRRQRS